MTDDQREAHKQHHSTLMTDTPRTDKNATRRYFSLDRKLLSEMNGYDVRTRIMDDYHKYRLKHATKPDVLVLGCKCFAALMNLHNWEFTATSIQEIINAYGVRFMGMSIEATDTSPWALEVLSMQEFNAVKAMCTDD